jgi:excisionase family DNA binding protein
MIRRRKEDEVIKEEKVLDVDATMQGTLTFRDPVNLRINGNFEGKLITKGSLVISDHAVVNANIDGESISIAGRVNGDIIARKELRLVSPAHVIGNIKAPGLVVELGARLDGNITMSSAQANTRSTNAVLMSADEVAKYLEVEPSVVADWAQEGRIPAFKESNTWKVDRKELDNWIASGKIK